MKCKKKKKTLWVSLAISRQIKLLTHYREPNAQWRLDIKNALQKLKKGVCVCVCKVLSCRDPSGCSDVFSGMNSFDVLIFTDMTQGPILYLGTCDHVELGEML